VRTCVCVVGGHHQALLKRKQGPSPLRELAYDDVLPCPEDCGALLQAWRFEVRGCGPRWPWPCHGLPRQRCEGPALKGARHSCRSTSGRALM
jgi:hypothetical protein